MSFQIKLESIDFGSLEIENLFIQEFMPLANGTSVKVYLLGLYYAKNPIEIHTNETIAKELAIPLEDVVSAWKFWSDKGLVVCSEPENIYAPHLFDVSFLSVRQVYLNNSFVPKGSQNKDHAPNAPHGAAPGQQMTSVNRVLSAISNPELKKMFQQIEYIIKRPLVPSAHLKILDWMTHYKMDPDMIERAFTITYEERPKLQAEPNIDRHFQYIESILASWYDKKLFSCEDLKREELAYQKKQQHYKAIYNAIGILNRTISLGDKEIVDTWSTQLDEETQLYIVKEATKRTTNPNMKYIDRIVQSLIQAGALDMQSAIQYFTQKDEGTQANASKSPRIPATSAPKKRLQNFSQNTISNLSESELTSIIQRKAARKKEDRED